jgi:hypothetical protein
LQGTDDAVLSPFSQCSDYTLAVNALVAANLGDFLQATMPWLPKAVVEAVDAAYPVTSSASLDVSWPGGMRRAASATALLTKAASVQGAGLSAHTIL